MDDPARFRKATFSAGCFFDVEAAFRRIDGVTGTVAGYTGGTVPDPGYEEVSRGTTGHAEAVGIVYDPAVIPYRQLLEIFWSVHDPTRPDGQGDYTGPQYRSAIFYHDAGDRDEACLSRDRRAASGIYGDRPILTAILPATVFWPAEECHQHFYEKCALGYCTSRQIEE
jgi:peptide-methionine (S)-S-oxide reductase